MSRPLFDTPGIAAYDLRRRGKRFPSFDAKDVPSVPDPVYRAKPGLKSQEVGNVET